MELGRSGCQCRSLSGARAQLCCQEALSQRPPLAPSHPPAGRLTGLERLHVRPRLRQHRCPGAAACCLPAKACHLASQELRRHVYEKRYRLGQSDSREDPGSSVLPAAARRLPFSLPSEPEVAACTPRRTAFLVSRQRSAFHALNHWLHAVGCATRVGGACHDSGVAKVSEGRHFALPCPPPSARSVCLKRSQANLELGEPPLVTAERCSGVHHVVALASPCSWPLPRPLSLFWGWAGGGPQHVCLCDV